MPNLKHFLRTSNLLKSSNILQIGTVIGSVNQLNGKNFLMKKTLEKMQK